ncbi:MAG: hypothetical protein IH986_10390 [Planctomycetes bacterium]|nr:hypothetical protein [Planctomycetota bacterium]
MPLFAIRPSADPLDRDTKLTFAYDCGRRRVERNVWAHEILTVIYVP